MSKIDYLILSLITLIVIWLLVITVKINSVSESETTTAEIITTAAETTIIVEPEIEAVTIPPVEQATEPEPINLGEFKLTAYCSCAKCCGKWAENRGDVVTGSIGKPLTAGYSIAVDPKVIPYGSIVIINGKEYEAMDCGGAIKKNRIDVYFNSHDEALEFGVQYATVYLKEEK